MLLNLHCFGLKDNPFLLSCFPTGDGMNAYVAYKVTTQVSLSDPAYYHTIHTKVIIHIISGYLMVSLSTFPLHV